MCQHLEHRGGHSKPGQTLVFSSLSRRKKDSTPKFPKKIYCVCNCEHEISWEDRLLQVILIAHWILITQFAKSDCETFRKQEYRKPALSGGFAWCRVSVSNRSCFEFPAQCIQSSFVFPERSRKKMCRFFCLFLVIPFRSDAHGERDDFWSGRRRKTK